MHPNMVAPHLAEFAQAWCQALHEIRDNEEKDSAFRGFCTLVQTNPAGIAKVSGYHTIPWEIITHSVIAESPLVLQCNRSVEPAFSRVEQYVPTTPCRVQAARPCRLECTSQDVPTCDSRETCDAVWSVDYHSLQLPRIVSLVAVY